MWLTLAAVTTQLLFIVFPGLVLHRALALRVLAATKADTAGAAIPETDLLVFGLLPGLALANLVGTVLAIFGLFRTPIFVAVMAMIVAWRWRDAVATFLALRDSLRLIWQSLARGELLVLVALWIFLQTATGLMISAQVPSGNVDVWFHNFPLGQSIVDHHGFVLPQIPNMFYGTYPIFFHMFFAEGLLFVDHVIAAQVINGLIYLGFLLSLLFCVKSARALMAIALLLIIIRNPFFSNGAADAMTDGPRVCFSILALTFTYMYLRDQRMYFSLAAGILAGAAVSGKYTELIIPILLGVSLLPRLLKRQKHDWLAAAVFSAACFIVGIYPYLRNVILLDNPIYPFFFGHPRLSDEYMAGLNAEVFHSMDPAFRNYSQNLFTWQGWRDFFHASNHVFLSHWNYSYANFAIISCGILFRRSYIIYPALWTLGLGIFWYTVGFMNLRWGLPACMMMLVTSFLVLAWLADSVVTLLERTGKDWLVFTRLGAKESWLALIPPTLSPNSIIRVAFSGLAVLLCFETALNVKAQGVVALLPSWMSKDEAASVLSGGLDSYLAHTRLGYEIYRYIGDHDLRTVLQPLDNGANLYQSAYNGGHDGNWILPWYKLPAGPAEFASFIKTNDIKYFVDRPPLEPAEAERLDTASGQSNHVEIAYELFHQLIPESHRIIVDPFGWELYAIDHAPAPD